MTKSNLFKSAHKLTRATIQPGDDYRTTFGACLKHLMNKPTIVETTFKFGNETVIATMKVAGNTWYNGEMSRKYHDVTTTGKRSSIQKIYSINAGSTRDAVIEHKGIKYGVTLGIDCNSKTKKANALAAAQRLIEAR
ncbi:MAG: hypothetical protein ACPGF7_09605 [Pontibacterium sp.]